jgi:uncharacterized ubiquitin-like protein YukD
MPENFIVTVESASGGFEIDLEIPSMIPFSAFREKLLEILKVLDSYEFGSWNDYRLSYKNRALSADETLASAGAFDGSRLAVTRV